MLEVFFFKQKTAYEMRISDWSSDVCSSDLDVGATTIDGVGHLRQQRRTAGRIERGDRVRSRTGALGKEADVAGHGILLVQCMTAATWSSSTRLSRRTTALPLWKPRTSSISWLWRLAMRCRSLAWYSTSPRPDRKSEEHTSELQSLMRISYAGFCLK